MEIADSDEEAKLPLLANIEKVLLVAVDSGVREMGLGVG